jgi:hypothetical protein
MHNEELCSFFTLRRILLSSKGISWTWHVAHNGRGGNCIDSVKKLVGKGYLCCNFQCYNFCECVHLR